MTQTVLSGIGQRFALGVVGIITGAATVGPVAHAAPEADRLDACNELVDLATRPRQRDSVTGVGSSVWLDGLRCTSTLVDELVADGVRPASVTGQPGPPDRVWCDVEEQRLQERLDQVDDMRGRYRGDQQYRAEVPSSLVLLRDELTELLEGHREACKGADESKAASDASELAGLAERLSNSLDSYNGSLTGEDWCRLLGTRAFAATLASTRRADDAWRDLLAAWPVSCGVQEAQAMGHPTLDAAYDRARDRAAQSGTASLAIDRGGWLGDPNGPDGAVPFFRWNVDGLNVEGAGVLNLNVNEGSHRVQVTAAESGRADALLLEVGEGASLTVCAQFNETDGTVTVTDRCRGVPPGPIGQASTGGGSGSYQPVAEGTSGGGFRFAGVVAMAGVSQGVAVGQLPAEGGITGVTSLRASIGGAGGKARIWPALDLALLRSSRPLEIGRLGGDGVVSYSSSSVEAGVAVQSLLWRKDRSAGTLGLSVRWAIPYDSVTGELRGSWWWLGDQSKPGLPRLPFGIDLSVLSPGFSVAVVQAGLSIGGHPRFSPTAERTGR